MLDNSLVLVDGYSFNAYNKVGLTNIGDDPKLALKGVLRFHLPELDSNQWKRYFSSVADLAPFDPKEESEWKFWKIPEGVTRLGGTFAIDGNNVVYGKNRLIFSHRLFFSNYIDKGFEEGVPGDTPKPDDVITELLDLF